MQIKRIARKCWRDKMADNLFSSDQAEYLKQHVKNISNSDLADLMNTCFGLSLTCRQINTYKKNHNLSSGLNGHFPKGHIPVNKGKKYPDMPRNIGMFKKGQKPHNYLPVGSERVNGDGYVDIKVADPHTWVGKHILIWESAHGKKPRGYVIIFADRNTKNFELDNLVLVQRTEFLIMNKRSLITQNTELTKSGLNLAKLYSKLNERKKKGK